MSDAAPVAGRGRRLLALSESVPLIRVEAERDASLDVAQAERVGISASGMRNHLTCPSPCLGGPPGAWKALTLGEGDPRLLEPLWRSGVMGTPRLPVPLHARRAPRLGPIVAEPVSLPRMPRRHRLRLPAGRGV